MNLPTRRRTRTVQHSSSIRRVQPETSVHSPCRRACMRDLVRSPHADHITRLEPNGGRRLRRRCSGALERRIRKHAELASHLGAHGAAHHAYELRNRHIATCHLAHVRHGVRCCQSDRRRNRLRGLASIANVGPGVLSVGARSLAQPFEGVVGRRRWWRFRRIVDGTKPRLLPVQPALRLAPSSDQSHRSVPRRGTRCRPCGGWCGST